MWQRSYFYNKARIAMHGWHLRWFTLTSKRMFSVPNRIRYKKHKIKYPVFEELKIDPKRLLIQVVQLEAGKRDFVLLCPSLDIFEQVLSKMGKMIESALEAKENAEDARSAEMTPEDSGREFDEHMESLIQFPADGSNVEIVFFFLLFPFRFLMHYTVPDVRTMDENGIPNGTLCTAWIAILMCLVWLIVGSYAMVASLEALAALMNIPDAVVVSSTGGSAELDDF